MLGLGLNHLQSKILSRVLYGDEINSNPNFDSDLSGYTNASSHWQWSAGRAYHPYGTSNTPLTMLSGVAPYEHVRLKFDYQVEQGALQLLLNGSVHVASITGTGTYTLDYTSNSATSNYFGFSRSLAVGNFEGYIDNISLKRVIGFGEEELVDPGFDNPAGSVWLNYTTTTSTIADSEIEVVTPAGGTGVYQTFDVETNARYVLEAYTSSGEAGRVARISMQATPTSGIDFAPSSGVCSGEFVPTASTICVYLRNGAAGTSYWQSVSIKKLI